MGDICCDNRFEIIKKAKDELLFSTNIDTAKDEMKVIDSFLFRCWQMGWLERYDKPREPLDIPTMTMDFVKENGLPCPNDYEFKDENGNIINATKIVLEKKKKEYPKTYEECCKVLNVAVCDLDILDNMLDTSEIIYRKNLDRLLNSFRKLLICRDAYWKLYGEEMGLGKPWEPLERSENVYAIGCTIQGEAIKQNYLLTQYNYALTFPTEEMRDAFYENFKELIEICKKFL